MLLHRRLLFALAATLLGCLSDAIDPVSVAAPVAKKLAIEGGKKMLKILSDKFTVDGRDGTIDKLLGGLCLIAGLSEETDEHSIGELWHRIEKMQLGIEKRLLKMEYNNAKRQYDSVLGIEIGFQYDCIIKMIKYKGESKNALSEFLNSYNKSSPFKSAGYMKQYLNSDASSILKPAIDLDTTYGDRKEIEKEVEMVLSQLRAIEAFHIGLVGRSGFDVTSWLHSKFNTPNASNAEINAITDEFIELFDAIYPKDVLNATYEINQLLKDVYERFQNDNPYWEKGCIENILNEVVLPKVIREPESYKSSSVNQKNQSNLASAILDAFGQISTTDILDIFVSYNSMSLVYNNSFSYKNFTGFKKHISAEVVVIRSKPVFVLSSEQLADMDRFRIHEKNTFQDAKMFAIRTRNGEIKSKITTIFAICLPGLLSHYPESTVYAEWNTLNLPLTNGSVIINRPIMPYTGYWANCDRGYFNGAHQYQTAVYVSVA
ncbi:hypothetical protein PRIPAC_87776 [Pristionchus pacificus]|uniref:Uncharacterized protein n=1 Tax=Pristionchus pacificus TaxID=54126 RepID=A0A2A6CW57_PRIPA|nr:hypothetical protein PRIPAC_87776 [Pristionchus pacificus]|eukprot:PDM82277.1 hypothetical protein PRIPAC_36670 [Pristionchus pacificus]